ncbi:MAG TPA: murein L,D-transpeptidase catalytic domain family protein [Flavobacterium sp.]|nr:murein L,D-transpeptidase catalytic domain family protein [Flavobacterium sp.]
MHTFSIIYKILPVLVFFLSSFSSNDAHLKHTAKPKLIASTTKSNFEMKVEAIYSKLHSNNFALPKLESFSKALEGFYDLKEKGLIQKNVLTLIDFSLSSNVKRLWVIDLTTNTILYHSLVAHGRNTGDEFANSFSNSAQSFKSSLGFYATGEIYSGKHGMSLRLDGLERGVNDNARGRGVVMHAADYVSNSFVKNHSRLGRSQGCPALPAELSKDIINTIKNKSCLFIYHPSRSAKSASKLVS